MQGTYSFLAYVTIAVLDGGHHAPPEQLRRFQHTVIVTSLAIAIYGAVQHYNLDPLPWGGDVTTRVAANAGNAIFLAAYLIMAFFLTLERVFTSFVRLMGIASPPMPKRRIGSHRWRVAPISLSCLSRHRYRGRRAAPLAWVDSRHLPLRFTDAWRSAPAIFDRCSALPWAAL